MLLDKKIDLYSCGKSQMKIETKKK